MSTISTVTSKQIQIYIKKGWLPEEIEEKYGCTNQELKDQLNFLYRKGNGSKAQSIYGQLEANRKKPRPKKKPIEVRPAEKPVAEEDSSEVAEEQVNFGTEKTLSDLEKEEKVLSDELIDLESKHKALSGKHRECINELRELQNQIKTIRQELVDCHQKFEDVTVRADEIAVQMNDISVLARPKRMALEGIRQEIADRNTVTICVSNDGTIEAPDNPDFLMDDDGYQNLKAEVSEKEECFDLRVRDIVTLARLIKICEKIERFSLICDNADLEKAFWAIR